MTTSHETQTCVSSEEQTGNDKKIARSNKKSSSWLHAITVVLVIAALGGAVYTNLQLRQKTKVLLAKIDMLNQQQSTLAASVDATKNTFSQAHDALQTRLIGLNKDLQTALQQQLYQNHDWVLLKARYFLELAQINAHWSNNTQTTATLLENANELLAHVQDQRLFPIRQAIAKEIAQVQALPQTDFAGILSQLDAAQTIVGQLTIKQSLSIPATNNAAPPPSPAANTWRSRLKESVNKLEKLVVIRRHDQDIQPLLDPPQEAILRENIRLTLQQTQWAVLQNNESLYQGLLAQVIKNIQQSFAQEDSNSQVLIKQLQTLQQIRLGNNDIILNQSLPLLNQVIESKNSPANVSTDAGDNS